MEFLTFCVFRKQQPNQKKVGAEVGGGRVQDHLRHIVQGRGCRRSFVSHACHSASRPALWSTTTTTRARWAVLCGDKIRYVAYAFYNVCSWHIVFQCREHSSWWGQPEAAQLRPGPGRRPGEACVRLARPQCARARGSNLLSYVYRLASSAAAHPDYITLRLLVMLQHGDCHPSNVSIPLQISSFMYEDDYSLLIGFTLAKRTKKRIRINCICIIGRWRHFYYRIQNYRLLSFIFITLNKGNTVDIPCSCINMILDMIFRGRQRTIFHIL